MNEDAVPPNNLADEDFERAGRKTRGALSKPAAWRRVSGAPAYAAPNRISQARTASVLDVRCELFSEHAVGRGARRTSQGLCRGSGCGAEAPGAAGTPVVKSPS